MITAKSFYSNRENTQNTLLFASSNAELGNSGYSASAEDDAHILCTTFLSVITNAIELRLPAKCEEKEKSPSKTMSRGDGCDGCDDI